MKNFQAVCLLALLLQPGAAVFAQNAGDEIAELRQLVADMKTDYEARISALEQRLERAERAARGAQRDAEEAIEVAEQTAIDQGGGTSAPNTFNPSIGAILTGIYADVGNGWQAVPGFQPAGEIGPGDAGFSVGETEINMKASVDAKYYGNLTFALAEDTAEVEEAWLQTTDLPAGITVTGGRFFSGAGYLNSFHLHADDFVDRPLPYQAFFGGRYTVDGIQGRWVAPTNLLVELGAELNWGGGFPATSNGESSPGAYTLFAKLGGDIGTSNSWLVGLSYVGADAVERSADGNGDAFTGDSDLTVLDFVWKWAPDGNNTIRNVKVQGEYFRRSEQGDFGGIAYDGDQDGWYLQGVWQFMQRWRVGLRHDTVDADNGAALAGTGLADPGRRSWRNSLMVDWSPSEFSRLRLQYTNDQVFSAADDQWYLQYIMSLGAHGAHQF